MAAWLAPLISTVGPIVANKLLNQGKDKRAAKAQKQQMQLSKMIAEMTRQRHEQEHPFRGALFSALQERQKRTLPRFDPGGLAVSNPYANIRKAGQFNPQAPPMAREATMEERDLGIVPQAPPPEALGSAIAALGRNAQGLRTADGRLISQPEVRQFSDPTTAADAPKYKVGGTLASAIKPVRDIGAGTGRSATSLTPVGEYDFGTRDDGFARDADGNPIDAETGERWYFGAAKKNQPPHLTDNSNNVTTTRTYGERVSSDPTQWGPNMLLGPHAFVDKSPSSMSADDYRAEYTGGDATPSTYELNRTLLQPWLAHKYDPRKTSTGMAGRSIYS